MDAASRYSAGLVCLDLFLDTAWHVLKTAWISPFCALRAVQGDGSVLKAEFVDYLDARNISFRAVPPRRHSKNVLVWKHGVTRSILLRLLYSIPALAVFVSAQQSLRLSNALVFFDFISTYEPANNLSRPHRSPPVALPFTYSRHKLRCPQSVSLSLFSPESQSKIYVSALETRRRLRSTCGTEERQLVLPELCTLLRTRCMEYYGAHVT